MPFGVKLKSLKNFGNKITAGASKFGNKLAAGVNNAVEQTQDVGNMIANKAQEVGNQVAKGEKVFNNVLGKVADVSAIAAPLLAAGLSATGIGVPVAGALMAGNTALQVGQNAYAKGRGVAKAGLNQIKQSVGELQGLGQQVAGNLKAVGNQAVNDVKNAAIRIGDEVVSNGQAAIANGLQRQ